MPKVSGRIRLCGTTAYVSQSLWIQSGKIDDNILFGKEMDWSRYESVLEACSLKKDLEVLPFGDQTVIGERGINLSGGQKQRIHIARALYHNADVFLFDDPFSAVDAHTGTHLFEECVLRMLASKTVIFVTHQVEFLPSANLILPRGNSLETPNVWVLSSFHPNVWKQPPPPQCFGFCPLFTPTLLWRRAGSDVDATTSAHRTRKHVAAMSAQGKTKKCNVGGEDVTTKTMMMRNKMTKLTHGEGAGEDDGGEDEDDDGGSPENADQLPYKELPPESRLSSTPLRRSLNPVRERGKGRGRGRA